MSEFLNFNRRNLIGVTGAGAGLMAAGMAEAAAQQLRKLGVEAGKITDKERHHLRRGGASTAGHRSLRSAHSVVGTPGRINVTCVETTAGNGYSFPWLHR